MTCLCKHDLYVCTNMIDRYVILLWYYGLKITKLFTIKKEVLILYRQQIHFQVQKCLSDYTIFSNFSIYFIINFHLSPYLKHLYSIINWFIWIPSGDVLDIDGYKFSFTTCQNSKYITFLQFEFFYILYKVMLIYWNTCNLVCVF